MIVKCKVLGCGEVFNTEIHTCCPACSHWTTSPVKSDEITFYCPDCKAQMDLIEYDSQDNPVEPYYKCPKCKLELDQEEAEDLI